MVYFSNGEKTIDSPVSYLHDSLGDLAEMAVSIKNGSTDLKASFLDEPGELLFMVHRKGDQAQYELRWFKDWISWGMGSESDFEVLLKGEASAKRIVQQITTALWEIHEKIGPEKYKELWCKHDFPIEHFKLLAHA